MTAVSVFYSSSFPLLCGCKYFMAFTYLFIQIDDSLAQCKDQSMQGEDGVLSSNRFCAVYICSCYQHFGMACWSLLHGLSSPRRNTIMSCITTQETEDLIYIVVGV
jgi:hypothetical protein